ncbi:putative membrane protein [Brevibacillus laterosporus GI-9]|nr:putative membrane protein [Brevibacillus laterosporus GI-9]
MAIKRVLGVIFGVGGLILILNTMPLWVWYAILGTALIATGWFLFHHK